MKTEIKTPTTPNFLTVEIGKKETVTVPIADFTEEELQEVGKRWTADLVESARRTRHTRY